MDHSYHSRFVWKLNINMVNTTVSRWLIQSRAHIRVCIRVEMRQYRHWTKCVGQQECLANKIIDKWKIYRNWRRERNQAYTLYKLCELVLCLSAQQFLNSYSYWLLVCGTENFHLPSQIRARCVRSRNFFDFQYNDCGNKNAYHVYNGKQTRNNATNHKFHRHIIRIEWLIIRWSRVWFALEMRYFCIRIDLNDASQRPIQSLCVSKERSKSNTDFYYFVGKFNEQ